VYPESRRKPAFKRRNVKELEERLAQVEDLLKGVGNSKLRRHSTSASNDSASQSQKASPGGFDAETASPSFDRVFSTWPRPVPDASAGRKKDPSWELLGLGQFERLPPTMMIEDLYAPQATALHYSHQHR